MTTPVLWKVEIELTGTEGMLVIVRNVSSLTDMRHEVEIGCCLKGSTDSICGLANMFALSKR